MNIDRSKIKTPQIVISDEALRELNLLIENDLQLQSKILRIEISGKGCEGFEYFMCPHFEMEDDFIVNPTSELGEKVSINIHFSPFCAYYLQGAKIEFYQDPSNDEEGFIITNEKGYEFHGKFWLKDQSKLPPMKTI